MSEAQDAFSQGMDIRRQMWGSEGAERRVAAASDFNRPLEDLVTRVCFGEVWTRPGIDHKTRSMLTLAILATLGKSTELQNHTRGAFNNGCSAEDIQEVFFHVAVYAGVPAAFDAFRSTQPVVKEYRGGE